MKKIHYPYGCPFAVGKISQTDTFVTTNWSSVTCGHCLKLRNSNYGQQYRRKYHKELND